ncbi:MAG TPA: FliM/FliN family flagellar motor switch protein [Candidatus Gastranaerophilales bacterium]|nr:FliM/FliN family flagellar motor switch protein [Candidatus Gastranaerophilales bacterium]
MVSSLQKDNSAELPDTLKKVFLHEIFHCFEDQFCEKFTLASREFLGVDFYFRLTGISYQPSFLWKTNDYFVTQINLGKEIKLMLKLSDTAINLILLNSLGKNHQDSTIFKLKDISELEAHILTAYNEFLHKNLSPLFLDAKEINSILHAIKNEKTLYLTFYIHTKDEQEAGRIILSFPQFTLRKITPVSKPEKIIDLDFFKNSIVQTNILVGKTRASLDDIKNLQLEDIIIFDESNLHTMHLKEFENINININPCSSLVIDFDNEENGDDIVNQEKNKSIWDSLEVEINASFEKIKIKLGDLREITEGLVIDVASLADNKVFIDVEGKKLAAGELVIIGDKYGVRVTEIFNETTPPETEFFEENTVKMPAKNSPQKTAPKRRAEKEAENEEYQGEEDLENMKIDEDFEESDFEMEEDEEEDEFE